MVSMLGRAGMCHYFGWLGTVVLLAVGSMKECMGGGCNHTNIDLGLLEGHPLPLALGSMPPAGVKLFSFFKLFGSETRLETLG